MNICKFAYDKDDAYCSNCDGVEFEVDGRKISSIECGGFEPREEEVEETCNAQTASEINAQHVSSVDSVHTSANMETAVTAQNSSVSVNSTVKISKLCYSSGITVEKNGAFYKFSCMEEWAVSEETDVVEARKALWKKLNLEIDKQVAEVMDF